MKNNHCLRRYKPNSVKCPISQCWRILKIPRSGSGGGWLTKINQFFLVHRYICDKFSWRSVQLHKVANRQTDRQTDKRWALYNLISGGNWASLHAMQKGISLFSIHVLLYETEQPSKCSMNLCDNTRMPYNLRYDRQRMSTLTRWHSYANLTHIWHIP